jgi:hypothetical protein
VADAELNPFLNFNPFLPEFRADPYRFIALQAKHRVYRNRFAQRYVRGTPYDDIVAVLSDPRARSIAARRASSNVCSRCGLSPSSTRQARC